MQLELQDIAFSQFQKFLVNGDTSICGEEQNCYRLYTEYLEETKSDETIRAIIVSNNIQYYSLKITLIDSLILSLQECYTEEVADIIRTDLEFGYELSETSYLADIKKIVSECTRYKVKLSEWQMEQSKISGGELQQPTFSYYALLLENMSSVLGREIRDDINTRRFCAAYRMFLEKLKTPKTSNGTRQNNRNI